MSHYSKFFLMIATSTITMFVLMYLNTYQLSHVYFSETRTYMALYMGATMAVIMLLFMLNMYKDKKKNIVEVTAMSVAMADQFFKNLKLSAQEKQIAEMVMREIVSRIKFLYDV